MKEDLLDNDVLMFKRANNASLYSALAEYAKKGKDFVSLLKKAKKCYENDTYAFVAQILNSQCTALAKQGEAFIEGLKKRRQQLREKEKLKPRQPVRRRSLLNNNNNNNNNKNILP